MGRIVIVANAPWSWTERFVAMVEAADLVFAADGGANHLARIGRMPGAVVGDLDSIDPSVRRWIGEARMVHRPDQDTTDLHKTLVYAVDERGAERVTVLAAAGGRLDHAFENLATLARWAPRAEIDAWDAAARIIPVHDRAELSTLPDQTISLVPLGRCEGVRTEGLRWPLTDEPLDLLDRTSVSNLAVGNHVRIKVAAGRLLVFLHGAP